MPKIEVHQDALFAYIGRRYDRDEFEELLTCAKAELDEPADENGVMKVELNDTNRPDLWSTAGLGRQLYLYTGGERPSYRFFSTADDLKSYADRRVEVDPALEHIRPYIAAFAVSGSPISEVQLEDVIQTQEKLCWNYGRKRSSIAMGVYRSDLIEYPVRYYATEPDGLRFQPLGMDADLTPREILDQHQKGLEFGRIVRDFPKYPMLSDARGRVLSFPPIINSADLGAVEVGDERLFVEMTGTDMPSLLVACAIAACDLADAGYEIHPVLVEYPYDTPLGRAVVTPFYFQEPVELEPSYASHLLGAELSQQDLMTGLERMGITAEPANGGVFVAPPPYRNDFLHPADVAEDVMIGHEMRTFSPLAPTDFTVGRLSAVEEYARRVKTNMVGLGYQEMIFNYLGSYRDFIERMYPVEARDRYAAELVKIANPMSENYAYLRGSALPQLLYAESISAHAVYPHRVFEVGKVARTDERDNYGSVTLDTLAVLIADAAADFNLLNQDLAALLFYLRVEYELRESDDQRFIAGRAAEITHNGASIGVFGELHPRVLENWGITVPCVGGEVFLGTLIDS